MSSNVRVERRDAPPGRVERERLHHAAVTVSCTEHVPQQMYQQGRGVPADWFGVERPNLLPAGRPQQPPRRDDDHAADGGGEPFDGPLRPRGQRDVGDDDDQVVGLSHHVERGFVEELRGSP